MKKAFAVILIITICLAFQGSASADEIQLLWNIPFGISIDEFTAEVYNQTGFSLKIDKDDEGINRTASLYNGYPEDESISVAGYTIKLIYSSFYNGEYDEKSEKTIYKPNQIESLNEISIMWQTPNYTQIETFANQLSYIINSFEQKYGAFKHLFLELVDEKGEVHYYSIYRKTDGFIDTSDMIKAYERGLELVRVKASLDNIYLSAYFAQTTEFRLGNIDLSFYDKLIVDNRDIYIPNDDELVDTRNATDWTIEGVGF